MAFARAHRPTSFTSLWLAAAATGLCACTEAPDVVASALSLDGGSAAHDGGNGDAGEADAGHDHHCDPSERFKRARIPELLVFDLYRMDCKIPLEDFMNPGGEAMISEQEFSLLLHAPKLEPMGGIAASFFCDQELGGYYLEPWSRKQRLVLCPTTCVNAKQFIEDRIAEDGCDPISDDDAGTP